MAHEIELKLLLDEPAVARLRADPRVSHGPDAKKPPVALHAVYYDTADHALARHGLALRLRREGRRWVQTVKSGSGVIAGLSTPLESECPAPGGRLDIAATPDAALREAVRQAAGDALLSAVCETVVKRTVRMLDAPQGGRVELAIDVGEIRAGGRAEPIREAELELKTGGPADLFALAKALFPQGPLRLSRRTKSARGYALAAGGQAVEAIPTPVLAAPIALDPKQTAESAAAAVLRGCLDQVAGNIAVTALSEAPEGPHQLRIGLRRLRTAATVFGSAIGGPALDALAESACELGACVGAVRDLDVLSREIVGPRRGAEPSVAALLAALAQAREVAREAARARLAEGATGALVFDLGAFVEGRGWLRPADFSQSAVLAEPVEALAARALERRWRKVAAFGARIATLEGEERHDLRKLLKKLRYAVEFFASLWPAKRSRPFMVRLKALQDHFGALQDAAMAREILTAPGAPWAGDAQAQRAVGYVLGRCEAQADHDWARALADWAALSQERRFWR